MNGVCMPKLSWAAVIAVARAAIRFAGLMGFGEFVTRRQRWRIAGYMHAVLNESWALWADSICLLGQNCMEQQESTPRPMH